MADALARQMAGQWQGLMSMMTGQGSSRPEIAEMALSAAVVVLTTTADALWGPPSPDAAYRAKYGNERLGVAQEEFDLATRFVEAETIINNALAEIRQGEGGGEST